MILLDTCAWWWTLGDPDKLSSKAETKISRTNRDEIYISSISLWEFAMMVARGRIRLTMAATSWMNHSIEDLGIQVLPITPKIVADSCTLAPFHGDPADRLITATARCHHMDLITKDQKIRAYQGVRTDW